MKEFGKILYSNKAVLRMKNVSIIVVFVVFVLNVFMVSAPLFQARASTTGEDMLTSLPGIEEALEELYLLDTTCVFEEGLKCEEDLNHTVVNGYVVFIDEEPTGEEYFYFGEYVAIKAGDYTISGDYLFLNGLTLNPEGDVRSHSAELLYAIISSNIHNDYFFIFVGQFIQNILYLLAISALIMVANYKQKAPIIRYKQAVTITVLAMLGPALLSAVVGMFVISAAQIAFMSLYSIRMMYVYFGLFREKIEKVTN